MPLPTSPSTTYVPTATPSIKAQDLNDLQTFLSQLWSQRFSGYFGDGSDGSYVLDGVQPSVGGLFTLSGSTYTLLRNIHAVNLTVTGASVSLNTNGYAVFCTGTLTTAAGGFIDNDGQPGVAGGSGGGFGLGGPSGFVGAGGNGGAGGAPTFAGSAAPAQTNSFGGSGAGGNAGSGAGGAGGAVTAPAAFYGSPSDGMIPSRPGVLFFTGNDPLLWGGGGGGGGGGGAGSIATGGGGGGGGGVMAICTRYLVLAAATDIHCNGGVGGARGVGGVPAAGAGGGGGGGSIVLAYIIKALSGGGTPTFSGAANCAGAGSGANGAFYEWQV